MINDLALAEERRITALRIKWRNQLDAAIKAAVSSVRFPKHQTVIQDNLRRALLDALSYRSTRRVSYRGNKVTRQSFGALSKRGRPDEELIRFLVISALFHAWVLAFGRKPRINSKRYNATPFVRFAEPIFLFMKFGKIETHLEDYLAYRKAILHGKSYKQWFEDIEKRRKSRQLAKTHQFTPIAKQN